MIPASDLNMFLLVMSRVLVCLSRMVMVVGVALFLAACVVITDGTLSVLATLCLKSGSVLRNILNGRLLRP